MVAQVKVVSILMIVNGALVCLMGVLFSALGPTMFVLMNAEQKRQPMPQEDKVLFAVVSVIYVGIGVLALTAGVLNIIAGIRALKFRGRVFALVALFCNLLPLVTCYCAPTSLGVMIYGLIVFFNAEVAEAFQLAAEGVPPDEIRDRFAPDRYRPEDEEEEDEDYRR